MKELKRGLFIDDKRELTVPFVLRKEVESGKISIDWYVVRSIRELHRSTGILDQQFDYVCFDYYLDERGISTGLDATYVLYDHYTNKGWRLPAASFHSSDDMCNKRMAREWGSMGGTFIDVGDDPNNLPKKVVLAHSSGGRARDPEFASSVLGRGIKGINRTTYGVKRKGGRP